MLKKTLFLSSLAASSLLGIMSVVSCNNDSDYSRYSFDDIGGLRDEFNPNQSENKKLIDFANNIRKSGTEKQKEALTQKTILLTTGGDVRDQSFNQSVWEAMSKFSREIGNPNNSYFETKSISDAAQCDAYDYALSKGYKVWILTGFQQGELLKTWLRIGKNKERFANEGVRVITVDWFADKEMEELTPQGSIMGLNFETQQAAFVAAYSAAKLLKEINQENNNLYNNAKFNTFGGGDFAGVTNFNYGFIEGIRQFNEDVLEFNKNSNVKHNYFVAPSSDSIELSTGFAPTIDSRAKVELQVDHNKPQVVFPVAGSLTANAIDFIKAKKSGQWVIGVDTNQALAFPNDKGLLLTSVEKRISIAIYKALAVVYGVAGFDSEKMDSFLPQGYSFNIETGFFESVNKAGKKETKNCDVKKGYDASFVGTSKSTLSSDLKFKNGTTYAQRYDEITSQTWDEFFGTKDKVGRFDLSVNQTEEYEGFDKQMISKKGLLPSQTIIDNFITSITAEIKPDELTTIISNILSLKNVKIGFMTAGNKSTYFDPQMAKIIEFVDGLNNQICKK